MAYSPNTLGSMFPLQLYGAGGTQQPFGSMAAPRVEPPHPLLADLVAQGAPAGNGQRPFQTLPQQPPPVAAPSNSDASPQPIAETKPIGMDEGGSLADLVGPDPKLPGPKFFSRDGLGPILLGLIGDTFTQVNGGQGTFLPAYLARKQREEDMQFDREKFSRELSAKREAALAPRIEQVGSTLGTLDPAARSYSPFYSAPEPFEAYASAQGHQRGTPEFAQAVKDYRLGSWSDPALENRERMAGVNYGFRDQLQDQRLATTKRGQDFNHADRQRGQTLTDARGRRGQDMAASRAHGGKQDGPEPSAIGPNGHKIVVRGNRWVDAATGQPVQ